MKYKMPLKEMVKRRIIYPDEAPQARVILREIAATLYPEESLDGMLTDYTDSDKYCVGNRIEDVDVTKILFLNAGGMSTVYIGAQDLITNLARKTGMSPQELKKEHKKLGTLELSKQYNSSLLSRLFACKSMREKVKGSIESDLRFEREGALMKKLKHPGIPHAIYADKETIVGTFFPQRVPLQRVIARGLKTARQRAETARSAIGILADIHDQSKREGRIILHRDYKPENILCFPQSVSDDPTAAIIDWGLVSAYEVGHDTTQVTNFSIWEGTPRYYSPEESLAGKKAYTEKTEVYVAGIVLWEALTGTSVPYANLDNLLETIKNLQEWARGNPHHDYSKKLGVRERNKFVPIEVERVVRRAISLKPKDRYPTMRRFHDELTKAMQKWPIGSKNTTDRKTTIIPYSDVLAAQVREEKTIIIPRPGEGGTLCMIHNPTFSPGDAPEAELLEWTENGGTQTPPYEENNQTEVIDSEDFTPTIVRKVKDSDNIRPDTSAIDLTEEERESIMPSFPDEEDDSENPKK